MSAILDQWGRAIPEQQAVRRPVGFVGPDRAPKIEGGDGTYAIGSEQSAVPYWRTDEAR